MTKKTEPRFTKYPVVGDATITTLSGGYPIALFSTRRQALHDLLNSTAVVER